MTNVQWKHQLGLKNLESALAQTNFTGQIRHYREVIPPDYFDTWRNGAE